MKKAFLGNVGLCQKLKAERCLDAGLSSGFPEARTLPFSATCVERQEHFSPSLQPV